MPQPNSFTYPKMGRGGASGMEGGGSAWRSPCNQRCVTTTWYRLLISIMFRLLLLSILLQAHCPAFQQIGLYVKESCVGNPQLNVPKLPNFFFIAGCTVRLYCTYLNLTDKCVTGNATDRVDNYCSKRNTTDLALIPNESSHFPNRSLVEVEKTKCNITVDIQNITSQFDGSFKCFDQHDTKAFRRRNVKVGEVPATPQNLSLVYEPSGNIVLWLDPVKQGYELKDNHTTWNIRYDWFKYNQSCSKKSDSECKQLNPEGLCQPCFIKLTKNEGCGQHASQGSVFNKIHFNISVKNIFATVPAFIQSFFPPDWIKPGPVRSILIQKINSSQFSLKVKAPKGFDQCIFEEINTESNKLVFNYTVDLVSLKEQSLLQKEGKLFHETYGFVRNLEDDELALSQTDHSAFTRHEMYMWELDDDKPKKPQIKVITLLPFAGYWYNISVQTKAHYWGKTIWEKEMTSETAPREGPQLDENFAYCPLINESCAVCLIYFKEIPRIQRGGTVSNHSLSLTLLNEDIGMQSKCGNSRMEEITGGQNNTFLVVGLPVGGVYNISLRASTSEGWSPNTTAVLHVLPSPPTFAAQDIVLESSGSSYDLSWKPGRNPDDTQLRYTVHNCSAIALQLFPDGGNGGGNESTLPTVPLNCVTNMASKELSENHTNSLTFDDVPRGRGLTPVFFLSATTSTNLTSGLLPVDCFYAKNTVPDKAKSLDVQAMEKDPGGIKVTFQLPCGQDLHYNYGRPDSYGIGVEKDDDGSVKCSQTMRGPGLRKYQISGNLKETIEYNKTGLEHNSDHCVCVYLFTRNDVFQQNRGFCKTFKTGTEPESTFPVWLMNLLATLAAIAGLVFLICVILNCKRSYRRNKEKFGTLDEREAMVPPPPVKKKLQNGEVRGFTNSKILSQDSGVHSSVSQCVIDMESDRPLVDAAAYGLSDKEGAEDSEEVSQSVEEGEYRVDKGSATDRTNSRYQSQSSNTESADNSQTSRGTAGRQATVNASRYSVGKRYSSQFAGERDMEEDEEEEDLEEEEEEDLEEEEGETEEDEGEESESKSAASEVGHEEREVEGLDTEVDEAEHLDSNDIKISMQVPPLSRQNPGSDRHLANKKPLPLAVAAILQQGAPSRESDLPQHRLPSTPMGPSADEIVLAFNKFPMGSTVAPGDSLPPASKATDSPQQDPQSSSEKPSIEDILQAFSLPPAIPAVDAVDVGPSDDAARTPAMSADSSHTDDIDPQENSHADVYPDEILETPQTVIDSNTDSHLDVDVNPDGETEDQLCVEDILLAANSSNRSQEASNGHPAVDTQKTADTQALVSASAEVKGAESASSRDTQKHDALEGLVKAEACAEPERDSEAAIASSPLSRPQLPQQDMSSIEDILLASQGCEWKYDLDSNPNLSHSEGNDSPKTSSSESNRDSIRLSGEFESGFESESAKETDGETDKSSTESLVAKKTKVGQSKQPHEILSAINPSFETTESKPTENEAGFGQTVENEGLEDKTEVDRKIETAPTYEPKHSASDHVNGSVVGDTGVSRSKHSASHAVKRLCSDIVPLLDKKNGLESSHSSDSNEFVSDNKAFSMEENSAKKAEQGRTKGSNKYCKVTSESRV